MKFQNKNGDVSELKGKILIVDDERDIIHLLEETFEMEGYDVISAFDGEGAIQKSQLQPDVILLDINMPNMNGFEVLKKIRDFVSCPIIFLTARIDDCDKVFGFGIGADDYIIKPFSIEELIARVAAHIRRDIRDKTKSHIKFDDDIVIDYSKKEIYINEEAIIFPKKEYEIIELLSINRGQIFDRERIYEKIWDYDSNGNSAVVSEHIRRIRAKFNEFGAKNKIETVWGVGYKWRT